MYRKVYHLFIFACLLFTCFAFNVELRAKDKRFTLVIDAGHGGHDAGAVGAFSKEKTINLNVALAFGRLVESNCPDVRVVYTRKGDSFVPLDERANIANRAKADLFISIHTNALPKGKIAYGSETYTLGMARAASNLDVAKRENSVILVEDNYKERYAGFNPNSSESYIIFEFMQDQYMKQSVGLARMIQNQYVNVAGRKNKGVHQAGFLVLRNTSMPSVLTELGFISTPEEERYLNSEEGIRQMGKSIYHGFLNYKRSQEGSKGLLQPFNEEEKAPSRRRNVTVNEPSVSSAANVNKDTTPSQEEPITIQPVIPIETTSKKVSIPVTEEPVKENVETVSSKDIKGKPVFKIQIFVTDKKVTANNRLLKGLSSTDFFIENNLYKYTYGETTNYKEILALRQGIVDKFPDSFIVAFKDGEKMNLVQAIQESKKNK